MVVAINNDLLQEQTGAGSITAIIYSLKYNSTDLSSGRDKVLINLFTAILGKLVFRVSGGLYFKKWGAVVVSSLQISFHSQDYSKGCLCLKKTQQNAL